MRDHTRPTATRPNATPHTRRQWARRAVAGCLVALAAACVEAPAGPGAGPGASPRLALQAAAALDITGKWTYHEDATLLIYDYPGDSRPGAKSFRCSSDGVYTFVQTGNAFTGSYDQVGACTAADGTTFPNNFTGVTVAGTVQGNSVKFETADGCSYQAAVGGPTLSTMRGSGQCGGPKYGGTYRATFSATR